MRHVVPPLTASRPFIYGGLMKLLPPPEVIPAAIFAPAAYSLSRKQLQLRQQIATALGSHFPLLPRIHLFRTVGGHLLLILKKYTGRVSTHSFTPFKIRRLYNNLWK